MKTEPRPGRLRRRLQREPRVPEVVAPAPATVEAPPVDIAENDPVLTLFQNAHGPVDVDRIELNSPGVRALREAGVKLVVPLVSQGELIGLMNLGPRLSEQEYSADDRKLLDNLASQAAPALRVAQLVREQEAEILTRERYEQEMRVATLIQQNFLPRQAPAIPGFELGAFYRPAREVGGDFYDFIELDDGRLGIVCGDVTDKGVPAALVMASTRAVLRGAAKRGLSAGSVLERVNELVCPEMPEKMFVTCFYGVLEPDSGRFTFANAGHDIPYKTGPGGDVEELRARGMPLGLMPGMAYEEKETVIAAGETVMFSSDGLIEAHAPDGDMFGCPRTIELMVSHPGGSELIDFLLTQLHQFTGPDWIQEDDITLVTLQRTTGGGCDDAEVNDQPGIRVLADLRIPSDPGGERRVMDRVAEAVEELGLEPSRLEKLKTAVAESAMNAIEHGNENRPDLDVLIRVALEGQMLKVFITDHGGGKEIPASTEPSLEAKLAGEQSPRGWGLFLIKSMVDEMHVHSDDTHHTIELVMYLDERGKEGT